MRKNPLNFRQNKPYFEGWYLKHQTGWGDTLALIPALHTAGRDQRSASLQVIAERQSWFLEYPAVQRQTTVPPFQIQLGQSLFTATGIELNVEQEGLSLHGTLHYGPFTQLSSDIMGPFRFFTGMECVHGVISMGHSLEGTLVLNGTGMDFTGGTGYIETDRGRSFPSAYLWTQCAWQEPQHVSLMLSIAAIPFAGMHFTGCVCAVLYGGREYRLATYRGVQVERWSGAGAVIRQGKYRLETELLEERENPLRAPEQGCMGRTIHESLCAKTRYRFWIGDRLLFDHMDCFASFEYATR